ncbi:NAD(P)H-binding protein [Kitasatospora paracochleata]|uniref:NADH-flavin reductase n=1 Tax=Kitasatospora paracochleata TaxID=58354 RepID=A0ABT1J6I2_9ACTN|nr:NAD(P)H-binding protein [Kitasatospora paracochleata]MCP2313041.1 putative NADH-flavin reductase [Kitasatospora paracochleata]
MRITVIAATGGIGREILNQALAAGHEVTAAVRDPGAVPAPVRTVRVDLARPDRAALEAAVDGADAVLSGLGARTGSDIGVVVRGTRAVIEAMDATGARRLVVVSAAPIGTVPSPRRPHPPRHDPGDGPLIRYLAGPLIKTVLRKRYADLALMEDALAASGLDWTSVRPPRLTDRPVTGDYRTALDRNVRGGTTVSRADVAHLMLRVLDRPETVGHTVGVGN